MDESPDSITIFSRLDLGQRLPEAYCICPRSVGKSLVIYGDPGTPHLLYNNATVIMNGVMQMYEIVQSFGVWFATSTQQNRQVVTAKGDSMDRAGFYRPPYLLGCEITSRIDIQLAEHCIARGVERGLVPADRAMDLYFMSVFTGIICGCEIYSQVRDSGEAFVDADAGPPEKLRKIVRRAQELGMAMRRGGNSVDQN